MREDFWLDSCGVGKLHCCRWLPEGEPLAIVQLIHGIAEFVERYDEFASFLTANGIAVVAEDHMGHGQSIGSEGKQGYFHGGWFNAVADSYNLMKDTMAKFPGVPYFLFGHSMGSFMARTILCKYPNCGLSGAFISGTGWQPTFAMPMMVKLMETICKGGDETAPNEKLQKLIFGGYNAKVENPRTSCDWLTRDSAIVDAYVAHPLCGFTPSSGLFRDMMTGICYIQQPKNLAVMKKDLPVFFVSGDKDPVGSFGKGVEQAYKAFLKAGMQDVSIKLYPEGRHEMLNELNRQEVFTDLLAWLESKVSQTRK